MEKEKNSLIKNEKYVYLLYIIGQSPEPLLPSEIKKRMSKGSIIKQSQEAFVYEMMENLNPFLLERYGIYLFNWKEITKDVKQQRKFLELLKKYFQVDWLDDYNESNVSPNDENNIYFEKTSEDNELLIKSRNESDTTVKIIKDIMKIYPYDTLVGQLVVVKGKIEKKVYLHPKKDYIYVSSIDLKSKTQSIETLDHLYRDPARFLDVKLEQNYEKEIELICNKTRDLRKKINEKETISRNPFLEINQTIELERQLFGITNNRRLWRYCLNIRGLLQYIVGEIHLENREEISHNRRIQKVVENISLNYRDQFPFLLFYQEFRNLFNKTKTIKHEYDNIEVRLIKEIASDVSNQLQSSDINFLKYYVIKKYSSRILFNTIELIKLELLEKNHDLLNMINEYQLINLKYLKTYLDKEKNVIEEHYNSLSNSNINDKIVKRTTSFLNNSLLINQQY